LPPLLTTPAMACPMVPVPMMLTCAISLLLSDEWLLRQLLSWRAYLSLQPFLWRV
jgi:hypothetical protein